MDATRVLLEAMKHHGLEQGHTLGLLHMLIGRSIKRTDGTPAAKGLTWRQASILLKKVRWPKNAVRDLGLEPDNLPPRDRQQFWYAAISMARLESPDAVNASNRLAEALKPLGYEVV